MTLSSFFFLVCFSLSFFLDIMERDCLYRI